CGLRNCRFANGNPVITFAGNGGYNCSILFEQLYAGGADVVIPSWVSYSYVSACQFNSLTDHGDLTTGIATTNFGTTGPSGQTVWSAVPAFTSLTSESLVALRHAVAQPSAPSTGFVLYVDSADGKLKAKGPSGTVTVLAGA